MKRLLLGWVLLFCGSCYADWDSWSEVDRKMFIASNVAIGADWMTTRYYAGHKSDFPTNYETNPVLGKYPSQGKVDVYFAFLVVSNYYITDWLPEELRGFYLGIRTGSHGAAAMHNVELGWKMKF